MLEDMVTSILLAESHGTLARQHNSVIRTGNGRDVSVCLSLTTISCETRIPRLILLLAMIEPRQAALDDAEWTHSGCHDSVADEAKPVSGGDVHVTFLNRSSRIPTPRGDARNNRS
ncbi:hypothetical protein H5410_021597 [Solanum commersonii]|uniref:Uncharacterized protein n=1 Tax=Solanum commersonii TaxID=4109 RepID=A0A9J5ZFR6_SOLCO|nr:hypothetical protein H5410_021597 [Solanum commersonii]